MSLRDQIRANKPADFVKVSVPEWGADVYVRGMTGRERDAWEASMLVRTGKGRPDVNMENVRAKLVALTACDEQHNRIFTDDDASWLGDTDCKALDRIFAVAQQLSGISDSDIESLVKN